MQRQLEQKLEAQLGINLEQLQRAEIRREMETDVHKFEDRFHLRFETFTYFRSIALKKLHSSSAAVENLLRDSATLDHPSYAAIKVELGVLTRVANLQRITTSDRTAYFEALRSIYQKLPTSPTEHRQDGSVLFVGVEREGRILAQVLRCLPEGHFITPHAKRIPHKKGLLVGINGLNVTRLYQRCTIIDGAIASGATIITMMHGLKDVVRAFHIFSAHATLEGLRGILRYALSQDLTVCFTVGHITSGIDDHFYAVLPDDPARLVVGDLGDTIWPIHERVDADRE